MFQLVDFTETRREFFFLLVDFRRNEGKGRWSNTWNAQLTFTGQIQIPHCIILPEAISVPLSPSQNQRGKNRNSYPFFSGSFGRSFEWKPRYTMPRRLCNRVSKFPKQRAVRACASTSRRPHPHPFALTEDKCQRAEREREREARGERRRGCRIVRASRTKRKRKSETRIGLIKASKQCRGCRRWLNNVWLAKSPYGT